MEANNAAILESLIELRKIVRKAFWSRDGKVSGDVLNALRRSSIALEKPPRNCDVGTADEQYDRWKRFCQYRNAPLSQNRSCTGCPVYEAMYNCKSTCELIWAQMPYDGGNGGVK